MSDFPSLSLVLGGASSGKSAFAERLVLSAKQAPLYIATAQPYDNEMTRKIELHRARRGPEWQLYEAQLDLAPLLKSTSDGQIILLDCLTLWLSNLLMASKKPKAELDNLFDAIGDCAAPVVAVSNELGLGLVPDSKLGRIFREAQGEINQRFAAKADLVVFVAAGLPLTLKGKFPEDLK